MTADLVERNMREKERERERVLIENVERNQTWK
jgi:hypothetical protein